MLSSAAMVLRITTAPFACIPHQHLYRYDTHYLPMCRCPAGSSGSGACAAPATAAAAADAAAAPSAAAATVSARQPAAAGGKPRAQLIAELRRENDWKNGLALWVFPDSWVDAMPRVVRSWLRCYIMCMLLYCVTGAAWAYYIYYAFRAQLFAGAHTPAASDMLEQIKVCSVPSHIRTRIVCAS